MSHEFVIIRNGRKETYSDYDQIPKDFEHVIKFSPKIPVGPHTEEQHEEIEKWDSRLQDLLKIERDGSKRR